MSIKTELARLKQAKADFKTVLKEKGATVQDTATIEDMVQAVSNITSDWNAPYGEVGYIYNRTHQIIGNDESILHKTVIELEYDEYGSIGGEIEGTFSVTPGENYGVCINGVNYFCTSYDMGYQMTYVLPCYSVDNESYIEASNTAPFILMVGYGEFAGSAGIDATALKLSAGDKMTLSIGKPITQKLQPEYMGLEWIPESKRDYVLPQMFFQGTGYIESLNLDPDETYIVECDHIEYECTPFVITDGTTNTGIGIGSYPDIVGYTVPFLIVSINTENGQSNAIGYFLDEDFTEDEENVHVISVRKKKDLSTNKLPNKFLDMDWIPKIGGTKDTVDWEKRITLDDFFSNEVVLEETVNLIPNTEYILSLNGHEFTATSSYIYDSQTKNSGCFIGGTFSNNELAFDTNIPLLILSLSSQNAIAVVINSDGFEAHPEWVQWVESNNNNFDIKCIRHEKTEANIIPDELLGLDWTPRYGKSEIETVFTKTITENSTADDYYIWEPLNIVVGDTYTLVCGDVRYESTAVEVILTTVDGDTQKTVALGVKSVNGVWEADENAPFIIQLIWLNGVYGSVQNDGRTLYGEIGPTDSSTLTAPFTMSILHTTGKGTKIEVIPKDFLGFDWVPRPDYIVPEFEVKVNISDENSNGETVCGMFLEDDFGLASLEQSSSIEDVKGYIEYNGTRYPFYVANYTSSTDNPTILGKYIIPIDNSNGEYNFINGDGPFTSLTIAAYKNPVEYPLDDGTTMMAKILVYCVNNGDKIGILRNAVPLPDKYFPDSVPLKSPNGTVFMLSVDDNGNLSAKKVESTASGSVASLMGLDSISTADLFPINKEN